MTVTFNKYTFSLFSEKTGSPILPK
jgi:hypothetical protein